MRYTNLRFTYLLTYLLTVLYHSLSNVLKSEKTKKKVFTVSNVVGGVAAAIGPVPDLSFWTSAFLTPGKLPN